MYNVVDELKEKTWLSVQPRKLRQSLDELLAQLKQLPAKYRSYDSYEYAKRMLHNYSKVKSLSMFVSLNVIKLVTFQCNLFIFIDEYDRC